MSWSLYQMKKVRCDHFQTTQQFLVDEANTSHISETSRDSNFHAMCWRKKKFIPWLTIRDRVDSTSVLQEPFILRCASMDTETG